MGTKKKCCGKWQKKGVRCKDCPMLTSTKGKKDKKDKKVKRKDKKGSGKKKK